MRFINSRRAEVKQQHPHLTFAEITKILGSEWSNLLAEEKQVWKIADCAYYTELAVACFWKFSFEKASLKIVCVASVSAKLQQKRLLCRLGLKYSTDWNDIQSNPCHVPRRLSLDENVRAKEGGKETTGETSLRLRCVPFPWSLAVHHQSLALASTMRKTKRLRRRMVKPCLTDTRLMPF